MRTQKEIAEALNECFDRLWFNRHVETLDAYQEGYTTLDEETMEAANTAAKTIEEKYDIANLEIKEEFDYGMVCGKLSALRWVFGDEWDNLDT